MSTFDPSSFHAAARTAASALGVDVSWHLETVASIDSTSSALVRRKDTVEDGTILVADHQNAGRGRSGNTWFSNQKGNLYLSAALRIAGHGPTVLPRIPLAAGVAAAAALHHLGAEDVRLKWPNDLLRNGKKVGGILCESPLYGHRESLVVVGLGLNLSPTAFPPELAAIADSLGDYALSRESAAAWFVSWLWHMKDVARTSMPTLIAQWKRRAEPFGRRVRVGTVEGIAEDLTDTGALILRRDDGSAVAVPGGVVTYVDAPS